jgi:hypothetical protein
LHIRPSPSFWLGWAGNSVTGASCASIPNRSDPMHLRMSAMSSVLSIVDAHLASRRTSITLSPPRCKADLRWSPDERGRPGRGLAEPDHRVR